MPINSSPQRRWSQRSSLVLVSVALVVIAGCSRNGAGADASAAPPAVPVGVVTLKSTPFTYTRELPGRVQASVVAEVRPQVSGIVTAMHFTEGGTVKAGQSLYQIDDANLRAAGGSAAAQLAKARAALASAQANAKRADELVRVDAISKQDNDLAQAQWRQAQADVQVAQAALTQAQVQLGHAQIRAPISGRIGRSSVTRGALVTAGQSAALATITQTDPVHVELTQSEAEFLALRSQLQAGTLHGKMSDFPVTIVLPDGQTYAHSGRVAFAEATVDPDTGGRMLRVVVPNPDGVLLPGSFVRAQVGSGMRSDAVLVPQRAVTRDTKGGATALVVGAGDKVQARMLQLGPSAGDQWVVDAGLKAGDRVIVEGLQKVQPGASVKASEVNAAASAASAASAPAVAASRR